MTAAPGLPMRGSPTRLPISTWHVLPVGPHWHLLGDPNSDMHVPPAVEGPQHLVVGAGVDADQGDPGGLEAERDCPQGRSWWDTLFSDRAKLRGVENWVSDVRWEVLETH